MNEKTLVWRSKELTKKVTCSLRQKMVINVVFKLLKIIGGMEERNRKEFPPVTIAGKETVRLK